MHKFLASAALSIAAVPALAICTPPYEVVFACDIFTSDRQVEICGVSSETVADSIAEITWNSALKSQPSDIFFHVGHAYMSSYKHYETDTSNEYFGIGYENGGRFYTAYARGSYSTGVIYQGFIEIFDSEEAFQSDDQYQHTERWECTYGTVQGNYNYFRP